MLSLTQREHFAREGFVHLPGQLPTSLVQRLSHWADELLHGRDTPGGVRKYSDDCAREHGVQLLSRVEYLASCHGGLRELFTSETLLAPVRALFGEEPVLFKDKLNYKLPGSGGFELHQDVQAGWLRYARDFVTVMIGIDATTAKNGCLELVPGLHARGLLGREWTPLSAADIGHRAPQPVPTAAGDMLLFGGLTPHGSAPNRTSAPRRVLLVTYNPRSQGDHYEQYFADKRASYPPDIERDPARSYRYRV